MVLNYHIALDTEVHTHRIGRTGRAGSKGVACSLYADKEHHKIALLQDYLQSIIKLGELPHPSLLAQPIDPPKMSTLQIDGGKKQKVRAGDILGALTGENGINGSDVGKINILENWAYVAVKKSTTKQALKKLSTGKLKGRSFRVWEVKR